MEKNWSYNNRSLAKKSSLLKLLGINENELLYVINNKSLFYIENKPKKGKNGKIRITFKVIGLLKKIQKNIKDKILQNISLPNCIVGGVKGNSYLSECKEHTSQNIIISEDIKDFYPTISQPIIKDALQYYFNFGPEVSTILSELVTFNDGLVQGSSLSTDIANIIFLEKENFVFHELSRLGCTYSRYIDDITISCDRELSNEDITRIKVLVYGMIRSKGLLVNKQKSHIMRSGDRKIVHNVKVNNAIKPLDKRKSALRMEVFIFEKKVQDSIDILDILKTYKRIKGLINTLKQQGDKNTEKYISSLSDKLKLIDSTKAKKTIRSEIRKCKSLPELQKIKSKLIVLSKVNASFKVILDSEYKTKKFKLVSKK
ncbi:MULTISPECIES: reverse transcriptase family protein [Providencia]|uniref:reverse transcriptase family protein n=1 Tax=Providencia TaxID=586 RepID=UPI00247FA9D3|nr:reverse transcriptase family protein [Providencia rettgeri]MDU7494267.1 reverse transcriptase family protein [Providencia rettgeri]